MGHSNIETPYDINRAFAYEQKLQEIHNKQVDRGVAFDIDKANFLIEFLRYRTSFLYGRIRGILSYDVSSPNSGKSTKPFKKTGGYNVNTTNWFPSDSLDSVSGEFCKIVFEEPSLTKRDKLGKQLIKLGWEPLHYSDKTNIPKLTVDGVPCSSLDSFGTIGKNLKDYFTYTHRSNQIKSFLKHIWYDDRGQCRISADGILIGTNTFRMAHRVVANIPKAAPYIPFGKHMRSLFTVPNGYKLMGSDAAGLEARILAHYVNDKNYTHLLLDGDIHTFNQKAAGLPTRDDAKTFFLIARKTL